MATDRARHATTPSSHATCSRARRPSAAHRRAHRSTPRSTPRRTSWTEPPPPHPTARDRDSAAAVAASLRGLQFALEAETLLREGSPTAEQLAQADLTHRTRAQELDQTIARFDEVVRSGEDPKAGSGP